MSRLELKIAFNGESGVDNIEFVPSNFISEYDDILEGTYSINSSTGSITNFGRVVIKNIKMWKKIYFYAKEDLATDPKTLIPLYADVRYFLDSDNSVYLSRLENPTYVDNGIYLFEYDLIQNIETKTGTQAKDWYPKEESYLELQFSRADLKNLSVSQCKLKIILPEKTSYVNYSNGFFDNLTFIKTLSDKNLPYFGTNKSDGDIKIIDADNYIKTRADVKELKNYFSTKIYFNGNQIGKFIGTNGHLPLNSKEFNYSLNDYIDFLEKIPCEEFTINNQIPLKEILNGLELYEQIVSFSRDYYHITFENLSIEYENYLKDFIFVYPYINCKNLKELWNSFLNATMGNIFVNENGKLEIDFYFINSHKLPIVIKKEHTEQDVEMNLIPDNYISKVNVNTKLFTSEFSSTTSETLNINNKLPSNVGAGYSTDYLSEELLKFINSSERPYYNTEYESLFYKFNSLNNLEFDKWTNVTVEKNNSTFTSNISLNIQEMNIECEGFLQLNEPVTKNLQINYYLDFLRVYSGAYSDLYNYGSNKFYIEWCDYETYNNVKRTNGNFSDRLTLYINSKKDIEKNGYYCKFFIPIHTLIFGIIDSSSEMNEEYYFKSISITVEQGNLKGTVLNVGESNFFKQDYQIESNSLVVRDLEEVIVKESLIVNTKTELDSIDTTNLQEGDCALVLSFSSGYSARSVIYKLDSSKKWQLLKTNRTHRYNGKPIDSFIGETIYNNFKDGKKQMTFTTSVYDFYNTEGILVYQANKGQILRVGDLIRLSDRSNETFKITKISASYEGVLKLKISAIEIDY